ncbi:response regulator [Phenylobacterium sp.]|uniref:response regulator n=1 Tax=Phenylobacterium sp. TaxID=1871053 RepID=UPI002C1A114B|nr:response regulator [Phenylobacterium sp.]HLZ73885.1 response regulator [Phenylobacterium sp.]
MRILFVEDNAINRRVVHEMLRSGGVEMEEAEDGRAGLDMIEAHDYDVILMDLRMPGMDGLTAIRHIRARPDAKAGLPVVVITADDGANIDAECLQAGADRVLRKPVVMTSLFETIVAVLAQAGDSQVMLA